KNACVFMASSVWLGLMVQNASGFQQPAPTVSKGTDELVAYRIVTASLDRANLHSNQGPSFRYKLFFPPRSEGQNLCVKIAVTGPVALVEAPPNELEINDSGLAVVAGKIRSTQVGVGKTVSFNLKLRVSDCLTGQLYRAGQTLPASIPSATKTVQA